MVNDRGKETSSLKPHIHNVLYGLSLLLRFPSAAAYLHCCRRLGTKPFSVPGAAHAASWGDRAAQSLQMRGQDPCVQAWPRWCLSRSKFMVKRYKKKRKESSAEAAVSPLNFPHANKAVEVRKRFAKALISGNSYLCYPTCQSGSLVFTWLAWKWESSSSSKQNMQLEDTAGHFSEGSKPLNGFIF